MSQVMLLEPVELADADLDAVAAGHLDLSGLIDVDIDVGDVTITLENILNNNNVGVGLAILGRVINRANG